MWARFLRLSTAPLRSDEELSRNARILDIEERLQQLEVTPPSPTILGGNMYLPVSHAALLSQSDAMTGTFRLLDLPNELIYHILSYLRPVDLAQIACTCRTLHTHAYDERQWYRCAEALRLPASHELPSPFGSWRELYSAHYPYWFLPQHKLWFADRTSSGHSLTGQVTLARYDYRMGSIETYKLYAENRALVSQQWELNPDVLIHSFRPRVQLLLDDPVVKLDVGIYEPKGRLQKEVQLTRNFERYQTGLRSRLFLTRSVPPDLQAPSMQLWPPKIIPCENRVRCESSTLFKDIGHKPSCYDELSETTFRTRVWTEFAAFPGGLGARMGEDVMTFSTIPEACYAPTADKPYQGIWVGDYSGHGCEFLLIIQKSPQEAAKIPRITGMTTDERETIMGATRQGSPAAHVQSSNDRPPVEKHDPPGCSGRLEAIKLTGDVNVPRGEYTFVAEDIGHKGLLRVAREEVFRGARVVKCWGHVASRGFIDDGYIPSQLIMMSHDCLAQYWEEFGHISFFKRIDIEQFLDVEKSPARGVII